MKKFYAFALAAMSALSMNAADMLYFCGNGEGLDWTPETPKEVAKGQDGKFTLEVNNLVAFKVSTTKGSWDEFNEGCMVANVTAEAVNAGTAVELVEGNPNIEAPWKGDYKIVIAGDLSTITMTTSTPQPAEGEAKKIYVRGDMNGWGSPDEWMFAQSEANENVYTINCTIEMGMKFKIADADWGNINYGADDQIYADEDNYWNYNAGDGTMAEDFTGTIKITLPDKIKDPLLVQFLEDTSVANVGVDAAAKVYYNLQGVRVANPENGLYIVRQGGKSSKVLVK